MSARILPECLANQARNSAGGSPRGLYELLIAGVVFAVVLALRPRLRRPTAMTWLVIALLAAGCFLEFFVRSDSAEVALGLEVAQWTSLALFAGACLGAWLTLARRARGRPPSSSARPATRPGQGYVSRLANGCPNTLHRW